MKKCITTVSAIIIMLSAAAAVHAEINVNITKAIGHAYNFQFDKSREIINKYITENPDDPGGYAGRIIFDFLMINQNPDKENIEIILMNLKEFETLADILVSRNDSVQNRFYKCFIDYYFMKSYALNSSWLSSFSSAAKARSQALDLKSSIDELPDLYYILGDQDYTASLLPKTLKPLMKIASFEPDPDNGLVLLETAMEKGILTRNEAKMFYISSLIYIEKDFNKALEITEWFLKEFPYNLSALFYKIDILLRKQSIETAENMLERIGKDISEGNMGGKWVSRYYQMYGNYYNAKGSYTAAIDFYEKALEFDNISSYTVAEITLEMGKLYDILGERKNARAAYWKCEKSGGLIIHREEAKLLRTDSYTGSRGSY